MNQEKKYEDHLAISNLFVVKGINNVNHKPHSYTIGPKHIAYASKHYSGVLDERTTDKIPCAVSGCNLSYEEHKSDKVLFLQLTRNLTKEEAQKEMQSLTDMMKDDKIDGICFVDTEEQFRIK